MNFAIPFFRDFKYLDEQNVQFNIKYKPKIKELDNFISEYGEFHRINIEMGEIIEERDYKILQALLSKHNTKTLIISIESYSPIVEKELNDLNIPHFYREKVLTWDKFLGFLNLNVTDIVIYGEICFSLENLSLKAKENNIKLRTFCNICQSSWDGNQESFKTFFMRPEDILLYGLYIDTVEFYLNNRNFNSLNVLYGVYCINQKWTGKIKEIIVNYKGNEDNSSIPETFFWKRLSCNKKCISSLQGRCKFCETLLETNRLFQENDIKLIFER